MKRFMIRDVIQRILLTSFLLFCCYFFIYGEHGLARHYTLNQELYEKQHELFLLKEDIDGIVQEINSWKNDPYHLEKVAREHLAMGYRHEIMYCI